MGHGLRGCQSKWLANRRHHDTIRGPNPAEELRLRHGSQELDRRTEPELLCLRLERRTEWPLSETHHPSAPMTPAPELHHRRKCGGVPLVGDEPRGDDDHLFVPRNAEVCSK